jgi:hypothetical protein
MSFGDDLNGF